MTDQTQRQLDAIRATRPTSPDHLWQWIRAYTGVNVARAHVCRKHRPPFDWLRDVFLDRPSMALVLGPRGGGKSFLASIATHLDSRFHPKHGTRILGGSKAQSAQIFSALTQAVIDGKGPAGLSDKGSIRDLLKSEATYLNGSNVSILAASQRSVRGPHVPSLKLDEVDEIDPDLRESAMGMCMEMHGSAPSVVMTSTWHRVGGPMGELLEKGRAGAFPVYESCVFEVLERCPEERSGTGLEKCPECPIVKWCHAERDLNGGLPLAKLSDGHYSIGSLIQKVHATSARTFEADYLCLGPRADGLWFPGFSTATHVSEAAEYDPSLPVCFPIDSGVFTGAVAFQVRPSRDGGPPLVTCFWDYLAEGVPARQAAMQMMAGLAGRVGTKLKVKTDPAGGARNPVGPTVIAEYRAEGLKAEPWPLGSVADALALVESLLTPASGSPRLLIHPRCVRLIQALQHYRRAKRGGQWQDYPEDPQHPHEDLVDALRGGLRAEFPSGFVVKSTAGPVSPNQIMF